MDSEEPQQPAVGDPAGQQLKRAREKLGLSLKDVADAQHLRLSIIQAIEDGHYDQIDSELFLKGYVRAYAKQVGVDADALIQSLDLELEPLRRERVKQELDNPLVDIERRRRKKRQVAKAFIIIAVLGAIALAGWKFVLEPRMALESEAAQKQSDSSVVVENTADSEADGTQINEAEKNSSLQESSQLGSSPTDAPSVEPEQADSAEQADSPEPAESPELTGSPEPVESSEQAINSPETAVSPESASGAVPEASPADESDIISGIDTQGAEVASVEPDVQPDPVFEESAQPDAVAATTRIEMSFVSDCWVQVTDSSGARLVASLQRDGDRISASGRAPFNVVIGAVDAVGSMSFGGEPVDLSDYRVVNNRTEFTLVL